MGNSTFGGSGSGDSSSVVQGGGEDLSRTFGQVKKGEKVKFYQNNMVSYSCDTSDATYMAELDNFALANSL